VRVYYLFKLLFSMTTNIFRNVRKGTFIHRVFAWFVASALLLQGGLLPLVASADVVVTVTHTDSTVNTFTLATSSSATIAYASAQATSTPTLDAFTGLLSDLNIATAAAKANAACSGSGTATANATASGSAVVDGETVAATANASATVDCTEDTTSTTSFSSSSSSSLSNSNTQGHSDTSLNYTIVATKIVCDNESDLPNWGTGGPDITAQTATAYVADHPTCHLAPDWKFQWGYGSVAGITQPGVLKLPGDFVGEADGLHGPGTGTGTGFSDWKTFGPTGANGETKVEIPFSPNTPRIWVREVQKEGYIPFTYDNTHQSVDNVSAEMYCHTDVLNYDNYDYVNNPVETGIYYCVAFNAKKKDTPPPPPPPTNSCEVAIVSDTQTLVDGGPNYATSTYNQNPRWTAVIPGATWIWKTFFASHPGNGETVTFTRRFNLPGTVTSGNLTVAADNSYTASVNGTQVGADPTEFNYFEEGKDNYNVASQLHAGDNTLSFVVKNWFGDSDPKLNPAGLLFKLVVHMQGEGCGPQPTPTLVTGKKIYDRNGNGVVDQNETGLADWQIVLSQIGTTLSFSTTTSADGSYAFTDVLPGDYQLCEVNKAGWTETYPVNDNGCYKLTLGTTSTASNKNFLNTESNKPECRDGKDNDGDGAIDYPADKGCDNGDDTSENQKPVITVTPPNPAIVTLGTSYTDAGATALDPEDGSVTVLTTGTVNTNVIGNYTITYNATDSKGLAADPKTRTVKVVAACSDGRDNDGDGKIDMQDSGCTTPEDNDENNKPVIAVIGTNPVNMIIGGSYTDLGATAFDQEDGTITPNIVTTGSVNTAVIGTYTITYNVSDSKGLAADPKTRTVNVNPKLTECNDQRDNDGDGKIDMQDSGCTTPEDNDENNKPVIGIIGANPLEIHLGSTFVDPAATATDAEDGNITAKIIASSTVNTAVLGTYIVTYNATDSKNLAADTKARTVKVITSCSDGRDNDNDGKIDYPADEGCDSPQDESENTKPIITLLGDVVMSLVVGGSFTDPGATAFDQEDGTITPKIISSGVVNANVVGSYTITYNATDSQNLSADPKTRTVNVTSAGCTQNCGGGGGGEDNHRPVITLTGANPLDVPVGSTFTDPGATAQDPEDGDITSRIVVTGGPVNTATVGTYTLSYNVSDSKGLPAMEVRRDVHVVVAPTGCTANCGGGGGGGAPITLSIFNEKLTVVGTTTVSVTWDTNQPANSRVVYGIDSVATLGNAPGYGYPLTTATDTTLTTSHTMTINGIPSAITTHFRPVSSDGVRTAVGIELQREPIALPAACFYLRDYLRLGIPNDPAEVTKLQTFLRNFEGFSNLAVTGFFDITTDQAVRAFQDKYQADVLTPWNLPGNTGYVYYTTRKKINEIYCQQAFPLDGAQLAEVAAFRALIAQINAQGGNTALLPIVGTTAGVGEVAGASSENGGAIASGASTTTEDRGRLALAQLLATTPASGEGLSTEVPTNTEATGNLVAKKGLAAVVQSLSDRTHLTPAGVYTVFLLILVALGLSGYFGRRYVLARQEADEMKF